MEINSAPEKIFSLEIINEVAENRRFKAALFDFDGTLSLIRAGWQDVMIPYFCEEFSNALPDRKESDSEVKALITAFVDELTGKQTIFQCLQLKEEIEARGGTAKEGMDYKNEYLRRLFLKIEGIRNSLSEKTVSPENYLVTGSYELLKALKEKGIEIYCASGTDQPQVREEAKMLGLDLFFGDNIFGALDEQVRQCSKELVINRLLEEKNISGDELLSFGDGFVEIELVHNVGGYTVAVATDEIKGFGINQDKRERLLSAGADVVVPDFSDTKKLINHLIKGR